MEIILIPLGKMILKTRNEIVFQLLVEISMLKLLVFLTGTLSISLPV